jgi:hypothetical protein
MAKVTFDGINRLIIINFGETSIDVAIDVYGDWKEWVLQNDNSKYTVAISAIGGDPIGGGRYLGSTFFLENGWKIRPYEGNHVLTVTGNLYTRDGSSPFVPTLGTYNVLTSMQVSNLIDTVSISGGSLTIEQIAEAVWNKIIPSSPNTGSYGEHVAGRLLTIAHYLGMK